MAGIDEPQDGNSSFALNAGQRVGAGRFNLMRQLGRGGMGVVWLAFDERLQEAVALKFLPPEVAADAMALDDLRRETRKSRRLTHPNIIRIHDLYEALDEPAFISMEYVEGSNLTALRLENEQRCFTWAVVAPLALQLCQALEYAHGEKVVHRDLKPANVMLDGDGRLKLADFGIAGTISDSASRISARFSTSGTLAYMSPQQMNGEKPRVTDDIYSLGATLYELLTSRPPFNGGDIPHQVRNVPATPMAERLAEFEITNAIPGSASALIMACLAKEATQRPQSARAVMERIQSSYDGDVSPAGLAQAVAAAEAQEAYKPEEAAPAEGSRGWMVWAAALTVVVLAIGGAAWYFAGHRAGSSEVQKKSVPEQKADTGQPADGANGVRSTTVHAPPIRDGLVLYFNFDEPPKNGVVPDESGSGNDGKVVNVQWTAQGRHGGAMQFSRSNSYITVPNRPSLNPAQITVAAWVKTSYSDNVWRRIFDKSYAKGFALSEGGDWQKVHDQGQLIWETDGDDVESRQHRLDDGFWHHVAATYDGAVQRLYLDGQLLTMERNWSGGISANNFDLTIGANRSTLDNNDEFNASFDGLIDEAMIFNRALSPDEIRELYESTPAAASGPSSGAGTGASLSSNAFQTGATHWTNSLGQIYVSVPGTKVLFSIWDTRVKDYAAYAAANSGLDESWQDPKYGKVDATPSESCPVVNVSWEDARAFCKWLTEKERKARLIGPQQNYRLPTDAEWSVAVGLNEPSEGTPKDKSGRIRDVYPWGTQWPPPNGAGNYADETMRLQLNWTNTDWFIQGYYDGYVITSPVGAFKPNRFGLYDMGGNVWQYCEDWYDSEQKFCVGRGASWHRVGRDALFSSFRYNLPPDDRSVFSGFRCVLVVDTGH